MFCTFEPQGHQGAHGEHGGKGLLASLLRGLRDLRGEARLRFTRLDAALRHLTLLDVFSDSTKRTHRGRGRATYVGRRWNKRTHRLAEALAGAGVGTGDQTRRQCSRARVTQRDTM